MSGGGEVRNAIRPMTGLGRTSASRDRGGTKNTISNTRAGRASQAQTKKSGEVRGKLTLTWLSRIDPFRLGATEVPEYSAPEVRSELAVIFPFHAHFIPPCPCASPAFPPAHLLHSASPTSLYTPFIPWNPSQPAKRSKRPRRARSIILETMRTSRN